MAKKKVPKVSYAPQPAEDPNVPYRRIYRPKVGQTVVGVIVSEAITGVWVHWSGSHDVPHIDPATDCPLCKVGTRSLRWKGYLEMLWPVNGTCFLAELSEGAIRSCNELATPGTPLRGRNLLLKRAGDSKNSRITAEVSAVKESVRLPKPCDVRRVLEGIWFGRTLFLPFDQAEEKKDDEGTL